MKVALIHYRIMHRGGLETRLFNYMQGFTELGHEVHVFTYKIAEGVQIPPGVKVHQLATRLAPKPLRAFFFQRSLKKMLPGMGFDFILSLGRTTFQDALIVAGTHLGFLERNGKKFRGISDRLQIYLDRRSYETSKLLLPGSLLLKEEMLRFYKVSPGKIHVLHPPIDTGKFQPAQKKQRDEFRKHFGMDLHIKIFVFVSSNHRLKGLPILAEVFSTLPADQFELWVAGEGDFPKGIKNLKNLGPVRETEKLFAAADGCLLPTQYDTFAQVIAESIICGTPVAVSKFAGASELVTPQTGIVVNDLSVSEWKKAVLRLAEGKFEIDYEFADRWNLSVHSHIKEMLRLAGKM